MQCIDTNHLITVQVLEEDDTVHICVQPLYSDLSKYNPEEQFPIRSHLTGI